jgi:hypothetical protein
MKKIVLVLLLFSSIVTIGYAQIVTTENQGLKRSSLIKVEKIKKEKIKKTLKVYEPQNFLIGGLSYHPSQLSMYAMVGTVRRYGLYGKLKTDFNFSSGYDYESYSDDFFIKDTKNGRFSITGGGMFRINNPLSLYAGLGYGTRWLDWVSLSGDIYRVDGYSYKGLETEIGINYKYKNVFFNIGMQTNSFEYLELNLGAGVTLESLQKFLQKK